MCVGMMGIEEGVVRIDRWRWFDWVAFVDWSSNPRAVTRGLTVMVVGW